jgi:hypothetical protein
MVYWEFLTNWSLAVNLDDLVASIPFPASQVETMKEENFLEQSRFSNSQHGKVFHCAFVLGPCSEPSNSQNQTRKYAQDRSKLYATLLCVATANTKRCTPSFSRFAPHHGRLFRPLSAIVISVTTIRRRDVALPSISTTVFATQRSRELTSLSSVLSTPDTRLGQLTVTVPHRL